MSEMYCLAEKKESCTGFQILSDSKRQFKIRLPGKKNSNGAILERVEKKARSECGLIPVMLSAAFSIPIPWHLEGLGRNKSTVLNRHRINLCTIKSKNESLKGRGWMIPALQIYRPAVIPRTNWH